MLFRPKGCRELQKVEKHCIKLVTENEIVDCDETWANEMFNSTMV